MSNRKKIYFSLIFLFIVSIILAGVIFYTKNSKLQVAFFDVGQGDAILISRGSKQILIDGGPSGQKLMEKLGEYVPFWDREIEVAIATHPDADHISGLVDAMKNYSVDQMIESGAKSQSQVFSAMEKIIEEKNIGKQIAVRGMKIKISDEAEFEIFHPEISAENISEKDTNAASVTAKLFFGENSFLFTGDLPTDGENKLINDNLPLSASVLKISHHGSSSATSEQFLEKVSPQGAIISVGKGNRYGHPNAEVLERLKNKNIKIFRTDENGDVVYNCQKLNNKCEIAMEL